MKKSTLLGFFVEEEHYPKKDRFPFISIETTHIINGKMYPGERITWLLVASLFVDLSLYSG